MITFNTCHRLALGALRRVGLSLRHVGETDPETAARAADTVPGRRVLVISGYLGRASQLRWGSLP